MNTTCCEYPLLKEWIANGKPNEKFIYITGYSASDTIVSSEIASYVYKQAVKGSVYLVRRRCSEDRRYFDYIAVKASNPPLKSLLPLPQDQLEQMYRLSKGARNGKVRVYRSSYSAG